MPYSGAQPAIKMPVPTGWKNPPARIGRPPRWPDAPALLRDWNAYESWRTSTLIPIGKRGRTRNPVMTVSAFLAYCGTGLPTFRRCEESEDDDLRHAAEAIRTACEAHVVDGGLARDYDANLAARVARLADRAEVRQQDLPPPAPDQPDPRHVRNLYHPACTMEELARLERMGVEPMLYSQAQLEAGMPCVGPPDDA